MKSPSEFVELPIFLSFIKTFALGRGFKVSASTTFPLITDLWANRNAQDNKKRIIKYFIFFLSKKKPFIETAKS